MILKTQIISRKNAPITLYKNGRYLECFVCSEELCEMVSAFSFHLVRLSDSLVSPDSVLLNKREEKAGEQLFRFVSALQTMHFGYLKPKRHVLRQCTKSDSSQHIIFCFTVQTVQKKKTFPVRFGNQSSGQLQNSLMYRPELTPLWRALTHLSSVQRSKFSSGY